MQHEKTHTESDIGVPAGIPGKVMTGLVCTKEIVPDVPACAAWNALSGSRDRPDPAQPKPKLSSLVPRLTPAF